MARVTVRVSDELKDKMDEKYPEINWSKVIRDCLKGKVEKLDEMGFREKFGRQKIPRSRIVRKVIEG